MHSRETNSPRSKTRGGDGDATIGRLHNADTAVVYTERRYNRDSLVPSRLREDELGADPAVRGFARVLVGIVLELHHKLSEVGRYKGRQARNHGHEWGGGGGGGYGKR